MCVDLCVRLVVCWRACLRACMRVCSHACLFVFNTYSIECDDDEPSDEDVVDAVRDYLYENTSVCGEYEDGDKTYFVFMQF